MPKKSEVKSAVDNAAVEKSTAATIVADVEKNDSKKKVIASTPLLDSDEIKVESLIPNVSYYDKNTGDFYRWDEVGHCEYLTVETLKNMWRNNKGYFRNMWLMPHDDRIINRFALERTYENFNFLMNADNYTRVNVNKIIDTISKTHNGLKFTLVNKIKSMIVEGELTDAYVIRALEKHFKIELMVFL